MPRRPFTRTFTRGSRRKTTWIGTADQGFQSVGANAKIILASFGIEGSEAGPASTVVRNRGVLSIIPAVVSSAQEIVGAYGMGVVSDQAFAAGAASIPGPWTDSDWEGWMVWVPFAYRLEVSTDISRLLSQFDVVIDSKAMRKVTAGETMVQMVESQATAFNVVAPLRTLFKLA